MSTTDMPLTCSVPEAGEMLGLGRCSAYQAAANGEIPTIRFGRLVRVPLAALKRMLEQAGKTQQGEAASNRKPRAWAAQGSAAR
jgi:excisionase family DNA binding protein